MLFLIFIRFCNIFKSFVLFQSLDQNHVKKKWLNEKRKPNFRDWNSAKHLGIKSRKKKGDKPFLLVFTTDLFVSLVALWMAVILNWKSLRPLAFGFSTSSLKVSGWSLVLLFLVGSPFIKSLSKKSSSNKLKNKRVNVIKHFLQPFNYILNALPDAKLHPLKEEMK